MISFDEVDKKWSLDRHIPVVFLIGLLAQTGAWIWWASSFATATEIRLGGVEKRVDAMAAVPERLVRLESQIATSNEYLRDIRDSQLAKNTPQ
jgi:hypothetical protein